MVENPDKKIVKQEILRLDKYLEKLLYSPSSGYYTSHDEQERDYLTAPQISIFFSDFVAEFIISKAKRDGVEKPVFVDLGGGTGNVAQSFFKKVRELQSFKNASIYLLEKSPKRAHRIIRENPSIIYINKISRLPAKRPVYAVANEFFDAFPPRVFKLKNGNIYEAYVRIENERKSINYVRKRKLSRFVKDTLLLAKKYQEEGVIEIQESAYKFLKTLKRFPHFTLLIFDYGYEFQELNRFSEGTLIAYLRHHVIDDFLQVGKPADISCHVNFSLLKKWVSEVGFEIISCESQGYWLIKNGFLDFFEKQSSSLSNEVLLKEKQGLKKIILPGYMGDIFKVLFAVKKPGNLKIEGASPNFFKS